jgi:outer membrane protein OmpA-like peptidoglycan-associated protein
MRLKSVSLIIGVLAFGFSTPAKSAEQANFYMSLSLPALDTPIVALTPPATATESSSVVLASAAQTFDSPAPANVQESAIIRQAPRFPIMTQEDLARVQAQDRARAERNRPRPRPVNIVPQVEEPIAIITAPQEDVVIEDSAPIIIGARPEIIYTDIEKEAPLPAPIAPIVADVETIEAIEEDITPAPAPVAERAEEPRGAIELFAVEETVDTVAEPLAPVETRTSVSVPNRIVFARNSTNLTDNDRRQIDAIINSFDNPQVNRIGILSYNYDDGNDSFRKKRQSLNRAVEVRSYLLSKGFKNFSIKVVNTTDDSSKEGVVEIEELR